MSRRFCVTVALSCLWNLAPSTAGADPITPVFFTASITGDRAGGEIFFRISTPDGHVVLETDRTEGESATLLATLLPCSRCAPGQVDLSGNIMTSSTAGNSSFTTSDGIRTSIVLSTTSFEVTSPLFTPSAPVHHVSETTVPIFVTGSVSYRTLVFGQPLSPVTVLRLSGSGEGRLRMSEDSGFFPEITLTFASEPKPVPEPATLLLFGTGVAAAGRRVWTRGKR